MDWLNESRGLLPKVYKVNGHKVNDMYMVMNTGTVRTQLKDAGELLAACLENVFSRMSSVPAGPVTAAPPVSQKPVNASKSITTAGTIAP